MRYLGINPYKMKYLSHISLAFMLVFSIACGSSNHNNEPKEYKGTIEATGITAYQYGSHRLITDTETFALKSDNIDLSQYEGQKVIIKAKKIEGYPIDTGPVYLNVNSVKRQ